MLGKILMSHTKRKVVLNIVIKLRSDVGSIRLSNLFMRSNKSGLQESGEIIDISNDPVNINIPRLSDYRESENVLKNDYVSASWNERATVDLSSSTYANTPGPPSEAININDGPYDSIISLGASDDKNEKFISEELITAQCGMELSFQRVLNHEDTMIDLYISNEDRYEIKFAEDAREQIERGNLDVVSALEYQNEVMAKVERYWHQETNYENGGMNLFVPYPSEMSGDIGAILRLYGTLDINNKHEHISRFNLGQLPLSYLIERIDRVARHIIAQWRLSRDQRRDCF